MRLSCHHTNSPDTWLLIQQHQVEMSRGAETSRGMVYSLGSLHPWVTPTSPTQPPHYFYYAPTPAGLAPSHSPSHG
jgi:hypothetical protein